MVLEQVKKAFLALLADQAVAVPEIAPESAEGEAPKVEAARPAVLVTDYKTKGFHLDVAVPADRIVAAAQILDKEGFFIEAVTGVDWMSNGEFETVYDFNNMKELCRVVLRVRVSRDNPEIETISKVFSGADWHERETHDFFGIKFLGHPDLSPLLLPEDADFHPLRKDYTP